MTLRRILALIFNCDWIKHENVVYVRVYTRDRDGNVLGVKEGPVIQCYTGETRLILCIETSKMKDVTW